MVLVPLVVWPTQRPAIPAAAFSQAKNQGSVIVLWGLLNDSYSYAMTHHLMCTFYNCTSLVMSPAYGVSRFMTINFETTWLCCEALRNVPRSLSVILTQPLTGVSQREEYLSFSPTTFGQLETLQFYACQSLRNRSIIKTLSTKYGLAAQCARCSFLVCLAVAF